MRIALISDIHGNAQALQAVLDEIYGHQPDKIVCLGDVATLGCAPKEVITLLKEHNICSIMGNHESALLNPKQAHSFKIPPPLLPSLQWTLEQLNSTDLEFIQSFLTTITLPFNASQALLFFHGSPSSNIESILPHTFPKQVKHITQGNYFPILAGGHTHIQMHTRWGKYEMVNPGSVGMPFKNPVQPNIAPQIEPWAEYGLINIINDVINVELYRIYFDINRYIDSIKASTNPLKTWLLEQYSSHI